jgi:cation diffusion facilitator CzcD-associated flavoprotein CzcO
MSAASFTDVAVIGAGPYGLSIAAHLAANDVRHRVFGPPMSAWRSNMPDGMYLKSPGHASNLSDPGAAYTLREYCRVTGRDYTDWLRPISRDLFADYGDWFQRHLVPGLDRRQVLGCERGTDGFVLTLEDGEHLAAKSVVISSGYIASAHVPGELRALPPGLASHSSAHSSFDDLRDKDVVVLGAGQSALESAALLHEAGARPVVAARETVRWGQPEREHRPLLECVRRPRTALSFGWKYVFFEHPSLMFHALPLSFRKWQVDTTLGPLGAWWLRDRVEGKLPIHTGWRLEAATATGDRVRLTFRNGASSHDLTADHVIAATGYHLGPASFPFLSSDLTRDIRWEHGFPALSRCFESTVPGLHFIGVASAYAFGPVMRFVAGARLMGPRLGGHLAARHQAVPARALKPPPFSEQAA